MFLPTLSILKIFATLIGTIITYFGYKRWKESKLLSMKYFYKAMFWHTIDCAVLMVMPLFSFNLYLIQTLYNLNSFAGTFFYAYLIALLFLFLEKENLHLLVKNFLIVFAFLNFILNSFYIRPAIVKIYPIPFSSLIGIDWQNNLPAFVSLFVGGGILMIFIIFVPLILKKTLLIKTPFGRKKGILIVLGIMGIFSAGIEAWVLKPMVGSSFLKDFLHGFLCASGQIFFGLGMLIKKR